MAAAVMTRIPKGSRLQDVNPARPDAHIQLSDIDSAFPLQEYIAFLVQQNPHDVNTIVNIPGTVNPSSNKEGAAGLGLGMEEKDTGVDEACWIYEQLRRLAQDLTHPLITSLQAECNRTTCPEMKAGEWLYLCVAHGTGPSATMEQCCAIDYITHTLDSATALLNSPRAFPSRLQIPPISTRQFPSLARRLSRIFAHAYYHHREAFEQSEAESSLYARFLLLAQKFDLVPADFLLTPGNTPSSGEAPSMVSPSQPIQIQPSQQQHFQMPSMEIPAAATAASPPQRVSPTIAKPPTTTSLPMQRSDTFSTAPRQDSPAPASYTNMTIKGFPASEGPAVEGSRSSILNRSRTDTMYRLRGEDFDLSEFASAAGDAMANVAAENRQQQQHGGERGEEDPAHEIEMKDVCDDEYVEVESVPHGLGDEDDDEESALERRLEGDPENEHEQDLSAVELDVETGTGPQEPVRTPGRPEESDPALFSAPEDEDVVDKVDDALVEVALAHQEHEHEHEHPPMETEEAEVLAVEPAPEVGETIAKAEQEVEEHAPLEQGEVRSVPAHLGLESEAMDEDNPTAAPEEPKA